MKCLTTPKTGSLVTARMVDPAHELMIREITREHYPEIYLGRAPVLLSCEVAPKIDEHYVLRSFFRGRGQGP